MNYITLIAGKYLGHNDMRGAQRMMACGSIFLFGKAYTYQVILFMGAHSVRHCLQIKELINHQDFPDS